MRTQSRYRFSADQFLDLCICRLALDVLLGTHSVKPVDSTYVLVTAVELERAFLDVVLYKVFRGIALYRLVRPEYCNRASVGVNYVVVVPFCVFVLLLRFDFLIQSFARLDGNISL